MAPCHHVADAEGLGATRQGEVDAARGPEDLEREVRPARPERLVEGCGREGPADPQVVGEPPHQAPVAVPALPVGEELGDDVLVGVGGGVAEGGPVHRHRVPAVDLGVEEAEEAEERQVGDGRLVRGEDEGRQGADGPGAARPQVVLADVRVDVGVEVVDLGGVGLQGPDVVHRVLLGVALGHQAPGDADAVGEGGVMAVVVGGVRRGRRRQEVVEGEADERALEARLHQDPVPVRADPPRRVVPGRDVLLPA